MGALKDRLVECLFTGEPARLIVAAGLVRMGMSPSTPLPETPAKILREFLELCELLGVTDEKAAEAVRNAPGARVDIGLPSIRKALVEMTKARTGAKVRAKVTGKGIEVRAPRKRVNQDQITAWLFQLDKKMKDESEGEKGVGSLTARKLSIRLGQEFGLKNPPSEGALRLNSFYCSSRAEGVRQVRTDAPRQLDRRRRQKQVRFEDLSDD
jgi:hypothetical protein